jgi:transposase
MIWTMRRSPHRIAGVAIALVVLVGCASAVPPSATPVLTPRLDERAAYAAAICPALAEFGQLATDLGTLRESAAGTGVPADVATEVLRLRDVADAIEQRFQKVPAWDPGAAFQLAILASLARMQGALDAAIVNIDEGNARAALARVAELPELGTTAIEAELNAVRAAGLACARE